MYKQPLSTFESWVGKGFQMCSRLPPGCIAVFHGKFSSRSPWHMRRDTLYKQDVNFRVYQTQKL